VGTNAGAKAKEKKKSSTCIKEHTKFEFCSPWLTVAEPSLRAAVIGASSSVHHHRQRYHALRLMKINSWWRSSVAKQKQTPSPWK
jgi:hypothetical protein